VSIVVDIQTVSIAIASASVVAGVIYYALQIRHQSRMIQQQSKIRETDLLVRLYTLVSDKEFYRDLGIVFGREFLDYDDYAKKCGSPIRPTTKEAKEFQEAFAAVMNKMELFGHLLKRGIVSVDFMYETYSGIVLWEHVKPLVEGIRKDQNSPALWEHFESYYTEMKKYQQKLKQSGAKSG
jgi:hypothetical protein